MKRILKNNDALLKKYTVFNAEQYRLQMELRALRAEYQNFLNSVAIKETKKHGVKVKEYCLIKSGNFSGKWFFVEKVSVRTDLIILDASTPVIYMAAYDVTGKLANKLPNGFKHLRREHILPLSNFLDPDFIESVSVVS